MMLEYQTECMKQLEPLEQMLSTVNEQCDKQIMKIRDDEKSGDSSVSSIYSL